MAFGINYNAGNEYAFIAGQDIPSGPNDFDIYYNGLVPVHIVAEIIAMRGGTMVYSGGHWTTIASDDDILFAMARIFIDTGVTGTLTNKEISGDQPLLWVLGDGITYICMPRANTNLQKFTGDGSDYAEWTIDFHYKDALASDPTGQSLMACGNPNDAQTQGLYLSSDGGESWNALTDPEGLTTDRHIINGFSASMWLIAKETTHVWYSGDSGGTWEDRGSTLSYLVKSLAIGYNDETP